MSLKPVSGKIESQELNDNFSYLDSTIKNIDQGSPKGVFDTVQELEDAFPNGENGIYIVDGKWYFWDGGDWAEGGVYQGQELGTKSVDYRHFNTSESIDLFNGDFLRDFVIVYNSQGSSLNGIVSQNSYPDSVGFVTKIKKNRLYVINKNVSDRFRISTFNYFPRYGLTPISYYIDDNSNSYSFVSSHDENYLAIQVSGSNEEPNFSVKEYRLGISIDSLLESENYNIFDGNYDGFSVFNPDGKLSETDASASDAKGFAFPTEAGKEYFIKIYEKTNRFRLATYNRIVQGEEPIRYLIDDNTLQEYSFTANSGEYFAYVQVSGLGEGKEPKMSIHEGSFLEEESTGPTIPLKYIDFPKEFFEKEVEDNRVKLVGNFTDLIISDKVNYEDGEILNSTHSDVYNAYDELMSIYPEVIDKSLIGYASDSNGEEDTNLPMYEYVFNHPSNNNMDNHSGVIDVGNHDYLTLLVTTGVHGTEKGAVWSLLNFLKQMLERHKSNDVFGSLQANIKFKVVPLVNPGGYNNNRYENNHDVNINQNYTYNFETSGDGERPYSEKETQNILNWFQNSEEKDVFVDFHGFSVSRGDNQISYFWSHNEKLNNIYASMIRRLSSNLKDRLLDNYKENEALGYLNTTYSQRPSASVDFYKTNKFKNSFLLEIRNNLPVQSFPKFSNELIEVGVELFANYLTGLISKYY